MNFDVIVITASTIFIRNPHHTLLSIRKNHIIFASSCHRIHWAPFILLFYSFYHRILRSDFPSLVYVIRAKIEIFGHRRPIPMKHHICTRITVIDTLHKKWTASNQCQSKYQMVQIWFRICVSNHGLGSHVVNKEFWGLLNEYWIAMHITGSCCTVEQKITRICEWNVMLIKSWNDTTFLLLSLTNYQWFWSIIIWIFHRFDSVLFQPFIIVLNLCLV